MTIYTSRPQQVEAVQWTGQNLAEVTAFVNLGQRVEFNANKARVLGPKGSPRLEVLTGPPGEGRAWHRVALGDWLLRRPGDCTDIWPMPPHLFDLGYQPVENADPERGALDRIAEVLAAHLSDPSAHPEPDVLADIASFCADTGRLSLNLQGAET